MSPDDKLSDWASHAVAPDDPPEPSEGHLDSADDALTKLFGDEVTPDVTTSRPVRIDADPVTGPVPLVNSTPAVSTPAVSEPARPDLAGSDLPDAYVGDDDGELPGGVDGRSRRERHRDWRRTEKARRAAAQKSVRFPIFTRSILLWMLILALVSVAFGASGAFWWANFNYRVSEIEQSQDDFESRSLDAQASIEQMREDALAQIDTAISPMQAFLSESQMLQFGQLLSPSVYEVATLDDEGLASAGAAFAVIEDGTDTYFVTSYATVKAATVEPAPPLSIRKDGADIPARVWNWDPTRDLALIKAPRSGVQMLDWVPGNDQVGSVGSRIFPVSGTGGSGATLTSGLIIDQSADGFQHTAPLAPQFRGGPIVTSDGKILAVASLQYAPLGFDTGPQIHFAVPVDQVCQRLISCSGGTRTPAAEGG